MVTKAMVMVVIISGDDGAVVAKMMLIVLVVMMVIIVILMVMLRIFRKKIKTHCFDTSPSNFCTKNDRVQCHLPEVSKK